MTIKRNTIQRGVVLSTVNNLKCHPTADEVYCEVIKTYPSISRGTVYRNLNQLAKNQDISKIEVPSEADRFDHKTVPHYHSRCSKCGKVFDVKLDYLFDLEKEINDTDGFCFNGHTITFTGICSNCNSQT